MRSIRSPHPRRAFLGTLSGSIAGLAVSELLARDGVLERRHHRPKAKRVIQLFMAGAASHVDLFDHKPLLEEKNGEPWDPGESVELFQSSPGACLRAPWAFRRYGASGKALSDIVATLGNVVDDMAFIHNLVGETGVHSQGTLLQSTGFSRPGFPSAGAWTSYALGSPTDDLPSFVVLPDHRGLASNGVKNWSSMFLPAEHQGTVIRPGARTPIQDLFPPENRPGITEASERDGLALLRQLNQRHALERDGDDRLMARVKGYELAAKMQLAATDALDVSRESAATHRLYGLAAEGPSVSDMEINPKAETEFFGRKLLIARRLIERGVRFVQVWSGNDNGFPRRNWDSHENIERDHGPLAYGMAKATAGLILDLKARGLLEDTIIHWTTEFGRMPCAQGGAGRDHNPFVFTNWLCGGGIRGGVTHGPSDEWGYKPADRSSPTSVHDVHATMLHLLGIDHERLTVRHNSIDRRLTNVHGELLRPLL